MMTTKKPVSQFYVILASVIAGISGLLFGYDTGVISGAMLFLQKDFNLDASQQGMVVSILLLGAAIGALGIGKFADTLGRKRLLYITSVLFIVGSLGLAYATTLNDLYIYRFILGLSIGVASFAAPSYISEIAPAHLRGRLVSLFQLSIVVGILATYIVNYLAASSNDPWRHMFLIGVYPAIILLVGLFFLPDSPRWLLLKGRETEAVKALTKLRGNSYHAELAEIKQTLNSEKDKTSNWALLFNKKHLPLIAIAVLVMMFQQLSGINAIIYYAPKVFMSAGLPVENALFATVLVGVVNLLSTILGLLLLDKLGRRPLIIFGSILMAIALITAAFIFSDNMTQTEGYIGIAAVLVYIFAFAISLGLFGWLIIAEVFPLNIRGEGAAIGATANWVFNIAVSFTFPLMLASVGINLAFGFFAVMCVLSAIYCIKFLPETKGVSLETIEKNLNNGARSRDLGVADTSTSSSSKVAFEQIKK